MKQAALPKRYALWVWGLILLSVVLGSQAVASAFNLAPIDLMRRLLARPPHESVAYIAGCGGVLLLLAFYLYFSHLDRYAERRSAATVFLNVVAPVVFFGICGVTHELSAQKMPGWISLAIVPVGILAPPVLMLYGERLLLRFSRGLGNAAAERQWRGPALWLLRFSLLWGPNDPQTIRRCGLILAALDEFERALALFDRLESYEQSEDAECLRTREMCYRALDRIPDALGCLLRLRSIQPEAKGLDRRVLDDCKRLGMHQEALDLLESGRLPETFELLLLRQRLNVEIGNYAQAQALIQRIARQEGPPHRRTIELYHEILERLPEQLEIKINLGLLLLNNEVIRRRPEGARLLEEALLQDPRRIYLCRDLAQFYWEVRDWVHARKHMRNLVEEDDSDPEIYLNYVQALMQEGETEEARATLQRMTANLPEDWRGHLRLARMHLEYGDLDNAEAGLAKAEQVATEEAEGALRHLRADLTRRRREQAVEVISRDVAHDRGDVRKRMDLIDQLLQTDRLDRAIGHWDQLLTEQPELLPDIERHVLSSIAQVSENYRLRDYMCDLYFKQGRFDDMLDMVHTMAAQSLQPRQLLREGCLKILSRSPDHVAARRELALVCRREKDWAGVTNALDPLMEEHLDCLLPGDKALWIEATWRQGHAQEAANVGLGLAEELAGEVEFIVMLIGILQELSDFEGAYNVFLKAQEVSPDEPRLKRLESKVVKTRTTARMEWLEKRGRAGKLTAAGEYAVGCSFAFVFASLKKKGFPVEMIIPEEGYSYELEANALLKGAKNKAAAKQFLDWAISKGAMEHYAKFKLGVTYPGIPGPEDLPQLATIKLAPMDFPWQAENRTEILEMWSNLFLR